jgi:hypothetical protein
MSQLQVNRINDASGGIFAPVSSVMRNRLINGNMTIAQRGTSFTGVSLFQYTLDRMKAIKVYTGGTTNVTQQADAPDASSKYSIRYTHATANTSSISNYHNSQSIETANVNDLAGSSVTLSFWYKSNKTGNHAAGIFTSGTTGGSSSTVTFTVNSANTWEYKTVTSTAFVGVTAWGADNSEGAYINIGFNVGTIGQSAVSSGDYFAISRMQLEKGTQATSFEYRQYGTELQLCQRYYWQSFQGQTPGGWGANFLTTSGYQGAALTTGMINQSFFLPVPMRSAPTGSVWDHLSAAGKTSSFNPNAANNNNENGSIGNTSQTTFTLVRTTGNNASQIGAYVALSAEL